MRTSIYRAGMVVACLMISFASVSAQTSLSASSTLTPAEIVQQKAKTPITLPDGVSNDWYQSSVQHIHERQYYFNAENYTRYTAANPKQNLGFLFQPGGYAVKNIKYSEESKDDWQVSFDIKNIGKNGVSIHHNHLKAVKNTAAFLEYEFGTYNVQYINNEVGLRQNFIINNNLEGQDNLEVRIAIEGDLVPKVNDNRLYLHKKNDEHSVKLYYDDLKVWDANHQPLEASLVLASNNEILISVRDQNAVYPITIDPLNHTPDWTDSGSGLVFSLLNDLSAPLLYGFSVSSAGDVNNDGYDDVIIGAPAFVKVISVSGNTFNAASVGAAFIYHGSANGLSAEPKQILQPSTIVAGALFGFSVSGAGDVDNDGKDDVVIGAPGDQINLTIAVLFTQSATVGKAYVYLGKNLGNNINTTPTVNISLSLKQSDFGILSVLPVNPLYGFSVSDAGDVNGDGYADIMVGGPAYVSVDALLGLGLPVGRVDIYYGSSSGVSTTPHTIKGDPTKLNALFGASLSKAGRVNNDQYDDIIIGSPGSINLVSVGSAYIFHGSSTGITQTNAKYANTTLNAPSLLGNTLFGYSVSGAGDVNGDGRSDVIIGEPLALDLFNGSLIGVGKAHIFYGGTNGINAGNRTQLTSPRKPGLLGGILGNLLFGFSVSGVRDVNCDGIDDVIIGEPGGTSLSLGTGLLGLVSANVASGQVYIFYGKAGTGPVDNPGYTFVNTSAVNAANLLGYSVASAGDVNGDGKPDILIGAPNGTLSLGTSILGVVGDVLKIVTTNSIGSTMAFHGCFNTLPIAVNDAATTLEDTPVTVNILNNDSDPDGTLEPNSVDLDPTTPALDKTKTTPEGTFTVNASGVLTFTPKANYHGPATVSYTVNDKQGGTSNVAVVTITVTSVNDAPIANNDNITTQEDVAVQINVTTNDTDIDGTINPATVDLNPAEAGIQNTFSTPSGVWSVNASGVVTFTPTLNFFGEASTTYTVNDNEGAISNAATIKVTVTPVNDLPVAQNDNATTLEDTPVKINVVANDSDVDGTINPATVDLDPTVAGIQNSKTTPAGTWTVNATGEVTYTPTLNFNGTASTTYVVADNSGGISNVATISVSVTPVNDAPEAVNDVASTDEDQAITINILANDKDVDGTLQPNTVDLNPATPTIDNTVTNAAGTWSVNNAGILSYTPTSNYNGTATISYTVKDNDNATSNAATVTVTVRSINDIPVAVADTKTINEDEVTTINIIANDYDIDGTIDPATVDLDPSTPGIQNEKVTPAGTFTVNASGVVTFTPTANYVGDAIASYTVNDNEGATSLPATIKITLQSVNDAPVAVDDHKTTNEDTPVTLNVVLNDTDVDGTVNPATVDLNPYAGGIQNSITNEFGTWSVSNAGVVTFTPLANFNGTATAEYTVSDNEGLASNIATITIVVTPINDAPVAVNDNAVTSQNNAVTFNITANDYDVDGSINPATIDLDVTTAGNQTTRTTTQGTWSVNNQGDLTFTPATDYVGTTSITYTVRDDQNLISNVATIQMVVQVGIPSNVNPIANNDNGKTNQGIPVTINIIANDTDPDGSIDASTVDLNVGTALVDNSITNGAGTWTVSNGIVTFTPTPTFTGAATLTYVVSDNRGALSNQATITINVNASPIANNDTHATNEDTPTTINILANDTDPNGTLNVGSVDLDPATTGIQNAITTNEGVWSVNASGVLSFQPKLNYFGPATITYTVRDNEGAVSNVATVTVTVNSVNDAPVAVNDNVTTLEDTPTSFNVTTNDTDVDGTINAATVDLDPTSVGRQTTRTTAAGSWSVDNNGIVTYTPALNYNGTATITYVVLDNQNAVSNVATISVSVTPVNDAPVAVNDVAETDEDHAVTVSILSNDTDVDGTLNAASVDLNPTTTTEDKNLTTPQGTWSVSTAGVVTFTPVLNFNGTATISYTVKDNSNALSNTATISVTVNPVNDPPVAVADNASVNEDVTLIIDVLANDTDPDGPLDPATIDLDPSTPGIQNSITNPGGTWSVTTDGKVKFVPTPNFNGNTSIQYTVNDDQGATSQPVAITVNVLPVNDAPVAQNDNATTLEDTAINISILTNDSDVDGTLAANSVDLDPSTTGRQNTITTTTGTWSVNSVGVLTYTPAPNYFGTGSITYTVNDNLGLSSNIATVSVIVQPVNDAPVAANDNATTYKGLPVTFTILSNDTDIDGTLDIATIDLDPSSSAINSTFTNTSGTWVANSNGTITFTPAPGFSGNAMASYTVNDNDGATSNIATITVNVIRVNEAPLAINDVALTYVNNPISFNITLNDIDLDGTIDISSVCIVSYSSNESTRLQSSEPEGDWQLNLNGVMTFTPAQDFVGEAKIYYTISDNEGLISEEAEITVTVAPRPPVAAGIAKHSSEPILQADNSSLITYTFTVKSYGSQVINNIEVIDDLAAAIPAPMTFTIVSGSATGGLIYNNQYNGITNTNLVTSASTLGIGATATITLVIKVHPNGNPGVITNSASVTSVSNDGEFTFTDISDSGFDPDEDQDGFPSGPTESDPTTTTVIERPIITVEKTIASQPVLNNDCSYSVTFRVDIKNPGNVDFTNIVVKDNLAAGIQSPATFKVVTLSSDALSVNPNFNGTTDINLLSSNNSLFYNEIATIEYTVVITPNKSYGPYTTTVVITAKDTDGEDFHFESDPYTFSIAPQEVVIPEGFSPNGDGVNDKFEITLSCGLTAKLTVFNRWGDRVFVSSNYQNDWAGNSNFGSFLGKALPEGTYFYNCELSNGKSYSSYITIKH